MVEEETHRRIEPVALGELKRETLFEAARADAGRLESLQHAEHRHHVLDIGTEPDGDIFDIGYHIAGLVHLIDQIGADHAIARRLQRGGHLLGQMFAKRRLARQRRLEIIIAAGIAAAALHVLPVGPCRPRRRGGGLVLRVGVALIGIDIVVIGIEIAVPGGERSILGKRQRGVGCDHGLVAAIGCFRLARALGRVVRCRFEQGIAFEFLFDIVGKFEIRQLQQLDGLLKLRRHDQGLSLAKLESRC